MTDNQLGPADIVLFATVIRSGSLTSAGASLGITKQAVSQRIAKMETALGVRLLERTTRSLRPTETGARYAQRCEAIAASIDEANQEARLEQIEPTGTLRISAPRLYGRRYLGPVLAAYARRCPKVRIDLDLSDRFVDLVEEGFDVAIRVGEVVGAALTVRKIDEGLIHVVASPRFLQTVGTPSIETLARHRCIGLQSSETWRINAKEVRIEPAMVVNDHDLVCEAAVAGLGFARLPEIVCRQALARGALHLVFGRPAAQRRPVSIVLPSRRQQATRVRTFVDIVTQSIERMSRRWGDMGP